MSIIPHDSNRSHLAPRYHTAATLAPLLEPHLGMLYRRGRRLGLNDSAAQDLAHDTLERALRFASNFQIGTNLVGWLQQILLSVFLTGCRRRRRERAALEHLLHDPCAWTRSEPPPAMRHLSPRLARAVDEISPPLSQVLKLVDLEGFAYREAAALLGIPVGTVMSRLARARHALAQRLLTLQPPASDAVAEQPARAA